ncbi:MAG: hypothetical protein ACK53L_26960, partial [Pirellulaceae bacterium]
MLAAEQAVLRSPAAGEQKQGHLDAECLLEQGHHAAGLAQATAADRLVESLAGFGTEHGKQPVQAVQLQG